MTTKTTPTGSCCRRFNDEEATYSKAVRVEKVQKNSTEYVHRDGINLLYDNSDSRAIATKVTPRYQCCRVFGAEEPVVKSREVTITSTFNETEEKIRIAKRKEEEELKQRKRKEEEERKRKAEEERKRKEEEERKHKEEEAERKRKAEEERKRKEEEERKRKEEEERKHKEEVERKRKEEAERKHMEELERKRKEEEERKRKEEEERKRKEEEAERKRKAEEERKRKEEEAERKRKEEEAERKRKEEAERKRKEEEAERKRREEEAERKRKEESERKRTITTTTTTTVTNAVKNYNLEESKRGIIAALSHYDEQTQALMRASLDDTILTRASTAKPFIGVVIGESKSTDVLADAVYQGSPAFVVGMRPGDDIVSIGGIKIDQLSDVRRAVNEVCVCGSTVVMQLKKIGEEAPYDAVLWLMTIDEQHRGMPYFFDIAEHPKIERRRSSVALQP